MPTPVSATAIITYWPGSTGSGSGVDIGLVEVAVGGLDRDLAAVRHGVAGIEREIEQRVFELVGIGEGAPQPAGQHGFERHRFAERAAQEIAGAGDELVGVDDLRLERLLAREGEQPAGQGGGALRALQRHLLGARHARRPRPTAADSGSCRPIMSRPPSTTVSRLLKSCATPPVSWPTASIFCAWRSDSSTLLRASYSASSARVRSLTASSSVSVKLRSCDQFALSVGDVDADADDADGLSCLVVESQAPRLDPAQLAVARPDDAELELEFARFRLQRRVAIVSRSRVRSSR